MKRSFFPAITLLAILCLASCRRSQYTCFCEDGFKGTRFTGGSKAGVKASEECREYKQLKGNDTLECATMVLE